MAEVYITSLGKTEGRRYMISDAAKLVDVESHVLRYWEEELDIEIPRNEMGHRYYTDYYIHVFRKIKELKEQGFLLKAIKIALPEIMEGNEVDGVRAIKEEVKYSGINGTATPISEGAMTEGLVSREELAHGKNEMSVHMTSGGDKPSKMEQFQMILGNIVTNALQENNKALTNEMSKNVSDSVIKEMDYLLRLKEEREEERFKKFDEIVRGLQKDNKMAAMKGGEKKRKLFGKK